MSKSEVTSYHCDKCGKKLKTCDNELEIVTSLSESAYWCRLHLTITHKHGMHNNGNTEPADLCKTCAVELLADALKRVRAGERVSAGVNHAEQEGWE